MRSCPNCRVTFNINYNFCLHDGTPLSVHNEPEIETVIHAEKETVVRLAKIHVNTPPTVNFQTAVITELVVAINIAQQFPYVRNAYELYEVTRGLWRLSRQRAERARYAFAVYRTEIKEVYEILSWKPADVLSNEFWIKRKREQGEPIDLSINNGRYEFSGHTASENVREKFVGKQMPVAHGQNPIRYFNC